LDKYTELKKKNQLKNMSFHKIEVNRPCFCLFPNDMNIYRAQIQSVNYLEKVAKVLYVDYGNSEEIDFSNIYEIDTEHLLNPINSIRCRLKNVHLNPDFKGNRDELTAEITDCFNINELYGIFSTVLYFLFFNK
jgi:hypothetical protein